MNLVLSAIGQGTVTAPNGFENVEGNDSAGPLFGGSNNLRTQMIYSSGLFSALPPEGVYITELRYRLDGQSSASRSGGADLEIRMSTSSQDPDALNRNMDMNVGSDVFLALPRIIVPLFEEATAPGGPNAFSVVIPLPNKFYYNPREGNLLVDAFVYQASSLDKLDWHAASGDGMSSALSGIVGPTVTIPVTQFKFEPIPEPSTLRCLIFVAVALLLRKRYVAS